MNPYDIELLPIDFKKDMELMKLLVKAKELYCTYNTIIKYQGLDPLVLLKPFIKQESFKSCQLAGTCVTQSDLYYIKYNELNDDIHEINNYMNILFDINKYVSKSDKLSLNFINKIHNDLLKSKRGTRRRPGSFREIFMWIGPRGAGIEKAEYIPIAPNKIDNAMTNFLEYYNKNFSMDHLIDIAISHAQFENIHPYQDGNGRIGRILIPIQGYLKGNVFISLFISEAIKSDEYSYYNRLHDTRNNKWENWVKFFLEIVIKQLTKNIYRLECVDKVYKEDIELFKKILPQKNYYKILNYLMANISTTILEASTILEIDYQTTRNYLNKLLNNGILTKHKIKNGEYVYIYIKMYQIHVPVDWL
ncbi:Fic family protein [Mycoplasmatota bacterium WC44]